MTGIAVVNRRYIDLKYKIHEVGYNTFEGF